MVITGTKNKSYMRKKNLLNTRNMVLSVESLSILYPVKISHDVLLFKLHV